MRTVARGKATILFAAVSLLCCRAAWSREVVVQTPNGPVTVRIPDKGETPDFSKKKTDKEYLEEQRKHPEEVKKKAGLDTRTLETKNFIIHGNIDPALMKETSAFCEGLHKEFQRIFKYGKDDKLYAGKLELFLWKSRPEFIKFAATYDGFDASSAGGYFRHRGPVAHVNMYIDSKNNNKMQAKARFFEVTIHELAHAHLKFYRSHNRIRPWVHEGFANLMAWYVIRRYGGPRLISNVKTKNYMATLLRRKADKGDLRSLEVLMKQPSISGADHEAYALAWIVVTNLVSIKNGTTFMKYVKDLKDEPKETANAFDEETLKKSLKYQNDKF